MKKIHHKIKQYIRPYKLNIYLALVYRLIVMLFFMQQGRFLFYAFNTDFFPDTTFFTLADLMIGGFAFDLTAVLYVNSLYILLQILPFRFTTNQVYQCVCKYLFIITNSIAVIANMIDVVYYRFTLRRSTALIVNEFSNEQNYGALLWNFLLDYWYMFIITGMVITGIVVTYKLVSVRPLLIRRKRFYYPTALVFTLLGAVLFVGGVRGGFAHSVRPITVSNASEYIQHPGEEPIVLNTPFSIIRTMGIEELPKIDFFSEEELETIYTPIHQPMNDTMQQKNVVVVIWESLGSEYVGEYNIGGEVETFTPFLDSLLQHSLSFTESISSGKKSIDAMSSIFASIPSLIHPFVLTPYVHNQIKSLPKLLKDEGYMTSFFHGAPNGSMGLLACSKKFEIENYYGKTEYDNWRDENDDFDNIWGIWDDKFMEYFSYEIDKMKEPFFTSIFTVSSHHPFRVPDEYKGKFPTGGLDMHPVIGYTDFAMRHFFERAKEQPWYKNTIFVITGDHPNQSKYPLYQTLAKKHAVPIILFDPSHDVKDRREMIASHIDIFPTLLNYLGYNKPFFSFGQDLLHSGGDNFAITYNGNYVVYYQNEATAFEDKATRRDTLAKAFIQQFNNRMRDDKLTIR